MSGSEQTIRVEESAGVVRVALNRPEVRNAFNAAMIAELTTTFHALAGRQDVRAVVLRGEGKSFSAGADAHWMRAGLDLSAEENQADAERMSDMFAALDRLPAPLIGRVHGAALGGGMGLMAVCDIVVAANDAVFGFTETRLGIIPAVISRYTLPRIGASWARALYLTGERFDALTAQRIGLVHWVVAPEDLDAAVEQRVGEMLAAGPLAAREAKKLIRDLDGLDDAGRRTLTAERIARIRTTPEGQEGLRAFLDRRAPSWHG